MEETLKTEAIVYKAAWFIPNLGPKETEDILIKHHILQKNEIHLKLNSYDSDKKNTTKE